MGEGHVSQRLPTEHESAAERLDSWKEIADYLKRSVRTVRRWETEESLPVRRHLHQKSGSVYAFKVDLDAWLTNRTARVRVLESSSNSERPAWRFATRAWGWSIAIVVVLIGSGLVWRARFATPPQRTARVVAGTADDGHPGPPMDDTAQGLFLRASYAAGRQTPEGFDDAIAYLHQAVAKDPGFAPAHAAMSRYYLQSAFIGASAPREFMPLAEAAARKSIALAPTLAEGHAVLAMVLYRYHWDWSASEEEFQRALSLNPNYSEAHNSFAAFLEIRSRDREAIEHAMRASELDPLSHRVGVDLGQAYVAAGDYDRAIDWLSKAADKNPRQPRTHFVLAVAYLNKGMSGKGISELKTAVDLSRGNPRFLGTLGAAYALCGRRNEALRVLQDLKSKAAQRYVPPTAIGRILAALGERKEALFWVEKAYQERDGDLVTILEDYGYGSLRSDRDFHSIVSRVIADP
jgi:tetratricopeptide (TPR) repeat protein